MASITRISLPVAALLAALPLTARASTLTVLHNFTGADGANPVDGLMAGAGGVFYGTASSGGTFGAGALFKIGIAGKQTVLHSFSGGADGANPNGGVIQNASHVLFGTTTAGGASGNGTVYSVTGTAETVLYSFAGGATDGANPQAGLVMDAKGNLYGTTYGGGASGNGTVFELVAPATAGGAWTEKLLYSFAGGTDGAAPVSRVNFDKAGNLYGTTSQGGASYGTIYQLQPTASGPWKEVILHSFQNGTDGYTPYAGLAADGAGNFYGAATAGGTNGGGTVFKLTPGAGGYSFSVLGSVPGWGVSGSFRDVLVASKTLIYATTHCDGASSAGSIYKLSYAAGAWTYTVLYNFTGGSDGQYSISNLVLKGGKLYGTTIGGGANGAGTVYAFTP